MDISDIASQRYPAVDPETPLREFRSTLEADDSNTVLVTEGNDCLGAVRTRDLVRSQVDDDTYASEMVHRVPSVERTENVREVARLLVENQTRVAPVYEGEELWGCVSADGILDVVRENLEVLRVEQIATNDVVTVSEDATLGDAVNLLREHDISRLPVVDGGDLTGTVTTDDIIEVVVEDLDGRRQTSGDRAGDETSILDLPVYDAMTSPADTTTPEVAVDDAVQRMFETNSDGLVVTGPSDATVAGVLTKTDVLRALTYTQEDHLDVQVTNSSLLQTTSREELRERIEDIASKFGETDVIHAHVRFQRHDEQLRGRSLVRCRIQLRTDETQLLATGEAYGADDALSIALDKLERNVLERKGKRSDEEYRGELLRKLNQL